MGYLTLGDMAQHYALRRQNVQLKQDLHRYTAEVTTGRTQDITGAVGGDYSYLADIERSLRVLDGYEIALDEAVGYTDAVQQSFDYVQEMSSDLSGDLLMVSASTLDTAITALASNAQSKFESTISTMNTNLAGRSLFAGTAVDHPAMGASDAIVADIKAAVAGLTSIGDVETALDDWFYTPGGGFDTVAYQGDAAHMSPLQLGDNETVSFEFRADAQEMRDILRHTAMAMIAGDETMSLSTNTRRAMMEAAGSGLLTAQEGLTEVRADLGYVQERVDDTKARYAMSKSGLEMAKNELISVDQYESATRLQNVQHQLESLYTMTVRLSKLSLMDYL